jgi:hypothetical protein
MRAQASVALSSDGNTALVGGPADGSGVGATWVFTRSGGVWTQQGGKLVGSGVVGSVPWASAQQGLSVALSADGNTAFIGGPGDNGSVGAAWVFTRSGGVWTQQGGKLVGSDAIGSAQLGSSVKLTADGNTALVGGPGDDGSIGAEWVFTRTAGIWTQRGNKLVGSGAGQQARQGSSVALSAGGNTALIGGPNDGVGATWVFVAPSSGVAISSSNNPSVFGQAITFIATVSAGATGTITFNVDGLAQPPIQLIENQAQLTIPNLSVGTHSINATYSGDSTYLGSSTPILYQTIAPAPSPLRLALSSNTNTSFVGEPVTFTATLSGGDGTFSGSVGFFMAKLCS